MPQLWNGSKFVEEDSPEGRRLRARHRKQAPPVTVETETEHATRRLGDVAKSAVGFVKGLGSYRQADNPESRAAVDKANAEGRQRDAGYAALHRIGNQLVPGSYPKEAAADAQAARARQPEQFEGVAGRGNPRPATAAGAAPAPAPAAAPATAKGNMRRSAARARVDAPSFKVADNRKAEQANLEQQPSGPPADQPAIMEESTPRGKDADQSGRDWVKEEKSETSPSHIWKGTGREERLKGVYDEAPAVNTDKPINREEWQRSFESQTPEQQRDQAPLLEAVGNRQKTSAERAAEYAAADEPEVVDNPQEEQREAAPAAAPAQGQPPISSGQASPGNQPLAATPAVLQAKPAGGNLYALAQPDARFGMASKRDAVSANPPASNMQAPAVPQPASTTTPAPAAATETGSAAAAMAKGPAAPPSTTQRAAQAVSSDVPPPVSGEPAIRGQLGQIANQPITPTYDAPTQNVEGKATPRWALPAPYTPTDKGKVIADAEAKATEGGAYEKPNGGLFKRIGMSLLKFAQGTAEGMVNSPKPFGFGSLNDSVGAGVKRAGDYQSNEEDRAGWRQRRDAELAKTMPKVLADEERNKEQYDADIQQFGIREKRDAEIRQEAESKRRYSDALAKIAKDQSIQQQKNEIYMKQADAKIATASTRGNFGQSKYVQQESARIKSLIDHQNSLISLYSDQLKTTHPDAKDTINSLNQRIAEANANIDTLHAQWGSLLTQPDSGAAISQDQYNKLLQDPTAASLIQQYTSAPAGSAEEARIGDLIQRRIAELGGQ